MFHPPLNLNRYVLWTDVLSALHVKFEAEALPCVVCCPWCGLRQLVIHQDTTDEGQWGFCKACRQAGDMIEFAAKQLNMAIPEVIHWLLDYCPKLKHAEVTDRAVAGYEARLSRKKNVSLFLTENRSNLLHSNVLLPFRVKMGMEASTKWALKGESFAVAATREQVDEFIGLSKDKSIFYGHGLQSKEWKEVLVIPYCDLPGRVSAMEFCYIDGDKPTPFHYRSMLATQDQNRQQGIAMFPALEYSDPRLGDDLFVFTDTAVALRAQLSKMNNSDTGPLPVVSVNPEASPATYLRDHCPSRRLIFWTPTLSAQFFKHVQALGGLVADHRPGENLYKFLGRQTYAQWINHLRRVARPWEAVLEDYLADMTAVELHAFLQRLDWSEEVIAKFIDGCSGETRQRLDDFRRAQQQQRKVTVDNKIIMETQRGWQDAKTDAVISEATFFIDKIVHYEDGRQFYYGRTRFGNTILNFDVAAEKFDKHPFKWLRDYFIRNNAGAPTFIPHWQALALPISQKFHTPTTVPGLERCGWDPGRSAFMSSNYQIDIGGHKLHGMPLPDPIYRVNIPPPDALTRNDMIVLNQPSYSVNIVWTLVACVLHDVLARLFRYPTSGTMLTGAGAENVVKVAKHLGCPPWTIDTVHHGWPANEEIEAAERRAGWPILFDEAMSTTQQPRQWLRNPTHNSIVHTDWYAAQTHMISSRWKYLDVPHGKLDWDIVNRGSHVISAFLAALTKQHMRLWDPSGIGQVGHIVANLHKWALNRGDNNGLPGIQHLVTYDGPKYAAQTFFRLLATLYIEGRVASFRSDCVPKRKPCPTILYLSDRSDLVWIPKPGLNIALHGRRQQLTVDLNAVSTALADAGHLVDEREIDGTPGWVVPVSTWELTLKLQEENKSRDLWSK